MIQQPIDDPTTLAEIVTEEWNYDPATVAAFAALPAPMSPVALAGAYAVQAAAAQRRQVANSVAWSYTHDVLQLGDPISLTVPNPRGEYSGAFRRGARISLYLSNPGVRGGARTLKHTGIVVRRANSCNLGRGSQIQLEGADLGWHLTNNDAPLWYRLQHVPLDRLLADGRFIDPSWGLKQATTDKEADKLTRRGVNNGRAQAAIDAQNPLGTLCYIQVEPGDKVADLLMNYARRINYLVNVGAGGELILFRPNYTQPALYQIEFHGFGENAPNPNNVEDVQIVEDISQIYTYVTCIGEIVGGDLTLDPANQNAAKRAGHFVNPLALPFRHNLNFSDGEIFDGSAAKKQAKWRYERGVFDSWQAVYTVRGHHQNGEWWEADQMCSVHDTENGLDGDFYISAVTCLRDPSGGDRTQITLRLPGMLQAAFGVMPRAPRVKWVPPANSGTTIETQTKTTVLPGGAVLAQ